MKRPMDPYEEAFQWMNENGFQDVIDSPCDETEMARLQEGIAAFYKARPDVRMEMMPMTTRLVQ